MTKRRAHSALALLTLVVAGAGTIVPSNAIDKNTFMNREFRTAPKSGQMAPMSGARATPLVDRECELLGGKVERWANCESGKLCVTTDQGGVKHGACIDKLAK